MISTESKSFLRSRWDRGCLFFKTGPVEIYVRGYPLERISRAKDLFTMEYTDTLLRLRTQMLSEKV